VRIWFPNAPSSGVDVLDRSQKAIGVSRSVFVNTVSLNYFRRYLGDVESVASMGPAITPDVVSENDDTSYFRRYLDDPAV
jgi:hypothetical protein